MTVNAIPTPTPFPIQFGQRDAKVIETATKAVGTISNKTIDSSNSVNLAALPSITNAKLAGSIAASKMLTVPGFVVKFASTGITGSTLSGVAVGDVCIQIDVTDGTVYWGASVATDTVPQTLDPADLVIVLRAAA